jgi:hypothetical protein
MKLSGDEAVRLLMKWHSEDNPVSLVMRTPGLVANLAGFIADITDSSLTVSNMDAQAQVIGEFSIDLAVVTIWDYREIREASEQAKAAIGQHVGASLQFHIPGVEFGMYQILEPERF